MVRSICWGKRDRQRRRYQNGSDICLPSSFKKRIDFQPGIPMTKKKFAELELSLLHLQQNVEIPETHLIIHPVIQRTVEQAQTNGTRPSINNIPPKLLNDST